MTYSPKSRLRFLGAAAFFTLAALPSARAAAAPGETVTGDYVEARSAAVYAGACHYNGEVTTAGREAVIAWKIREGSVGGVTLKGLGVVAVVAGAGNLAEVETARRSVLYVDAAASPAQRDALVNLLRTKAGKALGTVAEVKSVPLVFTSEGTSVSISAGKAATLNVAKYPCEHCRMPAQVWYAPLTPIKNADVAQGLATGFSDATLGVSWSRQAQDNVFIGTFAL